MAVHDPTDMLHRERRRAFDWEHGRAYEQVERAAQRLELIGPEHAREVALLRAIRRRLARHINEGSCVGE